MTYVVSTIDINDTNGLQDLLNSLGTIDFVISAGAMIIVISH